MGIRPVSILGASLALAHVLVPGVSSAQASPPLVAVPLAPGAGVLPRNTQVVLRLDETLNTKNKRATKKGETFTLSVARNVLLDGYVVIPRGSKAIGSIPWRTGKGAFGKSGKIELSFDYIEVGDQRIPIAGRHREEGQGNSAATIGTVLFLSIIGAGLITGHSAEIPRGREFTVWTTDEVPVSFAGPRAPGSAGAGLVAAAAPAVDASGRRRNPDFGNARVRCDTCRR